MTFRGASVCVLLLCTAAGAFPQRPACAQSTTVLESVVVFAERRDATDDKVPIAMSVFTSDRLSSAGIASVGDLASYVPSLDAPNNAGRTTTSLRIRRVGSIGNIPTFEPAVGVFVDGAFRARSFLNTTNLLAVDRVEVLRGPQTALYGKNVTAGLLGIYTRAPGAVGRVDGEVSIGQIDSPDAAMAGSVGVNFEGPLGSTLTGGLAARMSWHDHTLLNVLPGGPDGDDERQGALRAQLSWRPGDKTRLRFLAGYMRERDDQGESEVYLSPAAASGQVAAALMQLDLIPA